MTKKIRNTSEAKTSAAAPKVAKKIPKSVKAEPEPVDASAPAPILEEVKGYGIDVATEKKTEPVMLSVRAADLTPAKTEEKPLAVSASKFTSSLDSQSLKETKRRKVVVEESKDDEEKPEELSPGSQREVVRISSAVESVLGRRADGDRFRWGVVSTVRERRRLIVEFDYAEDVLRDSLLRKAPHAIRSALTGSIVTLEISPEAGRKRLRIEVPMASVR